jgi:hypothetical protein
VEAQGPAGRRTLVAAATVGGTLLLILLFALGASSIRPLRIGCAPGLDSQVCADTVTASLSRGLAPFHPLILSAYVEPGEVTGAGESGHRATVTYDLLGVPGPTTVRLFYDVGGHWGGVPNRTAPELAAWALLTSAIAVGIVGLVGSGIRRWSRRRVGGHEGAADGS